MRTEPRRDLLIVFALTIGSFVVYDLAPVSQSDGDTFWSLHEAYSVLKDGDTDLAEYH
jgi:hypothetical protein